MAAGEAILRRYFGGVHKVSRAASRWVRATRNAAIEDKANRLLANIPKPKLTVTEDAGHARFAAVEIGMGEAVEKVAERAHRWKTDPARNGGDPTTLTNILKPDDLLDVPDIMQIALHPEIYGAAAHYFGQAPWLVSVEVWITPPNRTAVKSQLYHFDHRDAKQAKVFVNLTDVDDQSGPLHLLSAADSQKVERALGYSHGRYEDGEVYAVVPHDRVISTVGPRQSGFIVDTARCLHYGSRGNDKERLVLMVNFARPNCESPGKGNPTLDPVRERLIASVYGNDPARAFSLQQIN